MTMKNPKASSRPTEPSPFGLLYSDTEAYGRYVELRRIRDWLKSFLDDMEHLRIDASAAIERIDEFWRTVQPCHGSLKTEHLARIRASLSGNAEMHLGPQLTALRLSTSRHWDYSVTCVAQDCERPPTGGEGVYTGPFPRKSGDHMPAFGYSRAMATGRL